MRDPQKAVSAVKQAQPGGASPTEPLPPTTQPREREERNRHPRHAACIHASRYGSAALKGCRFKPGLRGFRATRGGAEPQREAGLMPAPRGFGDPVPSSAAYER